MRTRIFNATVAMVLVFSFIVPATFFMAPQRAHALFGAGDVVWDPGNAAFNVKTAAQSTITAIQSTLTAVSAQTSAWAANADWVYRYVLQPLAFIMSGKLIKMMTAAVISFVIGRANGTGVPQFVVDVQRSMRGVADGAALAYLKQIGNTNSPFAGSIASALNTDYLTTSSLEGFWAANMCTLERSSQNVPAYLAGDWSQGGVAAWFALTTQTQNNPYMFYQASQRQMATIIGPGTGGVTGVRASQLSWGQGFMSWCGAAEESEGSIPVGVAAPAPQGSATPYLPAGGVNPGEPCMNSDGTMGTIKTPGSLIKATLDKVLGAQQDQVVRMGDVSGQINGILGNIATVFRTVNFASQILGGGGDGESSGGLLSAGASSPAGASAVLDQLRNTSSTLGLTETGVIQATAASNPDPSITGMNVTNRVTQYKAAWNTIGSAANGASASLSSLAAACTSAANTAALAMWNSAQNSEYPITPTQAQLDALHSSFIDAARAQAAAVPGVLATEVAPILVRVAENTSSSAFASTVAMAQQVQNDLASGSAAYATNLQALQLMPPTQADVANAQIDAETLQSAVATPPGSLTVPSSPGVTIVDRMNLISTNANALKASVCTYRPYDSYVN